MHQLDPFGTAFRYSLTKDGARHDLKNAPRNIDLENLRKVVKRLENFLETCLGAIGEAAQANLELWDPILASALNILIRERQINQILAS